MREAERLRVGKIKRGGKIDREVVAELVLRERHAVTIGDLAARCGNIQNVGPRQFLRLKCRNDRFFFWSGRHAWT